MSFVTWGYYALLAIAILVYWLLPHRFRWIALILASGLFCYALGVDCLISLAVATIASYLCGLGIDWARANNKPRVARLLLVIGLVICFGMLFVFKYLMFSLSVLNIKPPFSLIMPIGISFYTFQITGCLFDIYRGKAAVVKHLGKYAVSVWFFPKIMQGPIEPVSRFIPQLEEKRVFDPVNARYSALIILLGLFKKTVIADRLAVVVNAVFTSIAAGKSLSSLSVAIGVVFYAFQLYADFSGYTDIALGSAGMLGFRLSPNFRQPYLARSIADFWRRWHITLSAWLRDYIYIPMGGSRVSKARWALNVLTVFLVSGIWHGAGWTFVIWGLLHGLYQVVGKWTSAPRAKLQERFPAKLKPVTAAFSVIFTFILVDIAWVFFRSPTLGDAARVFELIAMGGGWQFSLKELGIVINEWYLCVGLIVAWMLMEIVNEHSEPARWLESRPLPIRWTAYLALLFSIILFGFYGSLSPSSFLYVGF